MTEANSTVAKTISQPMPKSVLIWCFVCKLWVPAWPKADYCPRCGNDEIEHDE